MEPYIFYTAGSSPALTAARRALEAKGISFIDHISPDITHLLLPVPSFAAGGGLRGGGRLEDILPRLPENITLIGGKLRQEGYRVMDLLEDEGYLAQNAAITAHCAAALAMEKLPVILAGCPVLVIGWGRIGKCLSLLLKGMGAKVTVAARKEADRAMAGALGLGAQALDGLPSGFRVIFNTAPGVTFSWEALCPEDCLRIELASQPGFVGKDTLQARGLPGKDAPESSGELIAKTVMRLLEMR